MDDFLLTLEFLTTTDTSAKTSTTSLVAELKERFASLSLAVARDAMDFIVAKKGLSGCPKVSREGGNARAPLKDYPLRWKTAKELIESAEVLVVVAMDLELRTVERALRKPYKDVGSTFPPCIDHAVVGLVGRCPVLLIKTKECGSWESYAATTSALFAAPAVEEVLKIGTAVYMRKDEPAAKNDDGPVSLGDLCIMDGSRARAVLTWVRDEFGEQRCYTHGDVMPPAKLREWQEEQKFQLDDHKIWGKAVYSGQFFRHAEKDLPAGMVGEMELAGIHRAIRATQRSLKLGAISAVTEIFDPRQFIVAQYAHQDKAQLASSLCEALKSYITFRAAKEERQ